MPTATVRPYINVLAGIASDWQILDASSVSPSSYSLPIFPPSVPGIAVSGTVGVYTYLPNNCTNSPNSEG